MEEVDARAILAVGIEASVPDIEAAYRERVSEVRKRFEKAIDRRARAQLEREFEALEDALNSLLSKPVERILVDDHTANADPEPAEPILISNELKPGKIFAGRFELQRELSNDCAGSVWLAEEYSGQHQVALTFLPDVLTGDSGALDDLKKEVRARINLRHPNLARMYALVEDEGRVAVSMEHVDGQNLSQLRLSKQSQVFEAKDLGTWVKELCSALEHLHKEARLIHGAIQPNCLIVNPAGSLQLADLGLGRLINDWLIRLIGGPGTNGTLAYSSPQRARGEKLMVADDVYSLGASLYELLTGNPPFYQGDIRAQIEEQSAPSIAERRIQLGIVGELIPNNWEETIAACLAKQASQRPKSLIEVIRRLEKVDVQPAVFPTDQPQAVSSLAKPASSPPGPASTPSKRESIPAQPVSAPSEPLSTPVQPVPSAATASPATVVPDSLSAKRPSTPVAPISPHSQPSRPPPGPTAPPVERATPPVHLTASPVKTPETPKKSVSTPAKGPQQPGAPAPPPVKQSFLGRRRALVVGGIICVLILASLLTFFWPHSESPPSAKPNAQPSASGSIAQPTSPPLVTASPVATASPSITASPVVTPSSEASTTVSPNESATASPTPLTQPEIDATREEVIKRINAAPGYSAEEKAVLIKKMERARKMERLSVVRFDFGQTALNRPALDGLLKAFEQPEVQDKLSDQTMILVVAGYADTGGRADINLGISQQRAETVAKILRRRIKLTNPMQTIGMGGTELLNNKRPDQNRAVEIWAVTVF
jgi:serine/threonine protein kinase